MTTKDDPGRVGSETAISGAWPLPKYETGPAMAMRVYVVRADDKILGLFTDKPVADEFAKEWVADVEEHLLRDGNNAADPTCSNRYWHHLGDWCKVCGGIG